MDTQESHGEIMQSQSSSPSIFEIIPRVVSAPSEAFAAINEKPRILIPLLILIIIVALASVLPVEQQSQLQYQIMSQSSKMPDNVIEQMREQANNVTMAGRISSAVGGAIMVVLFSVLGALVIWFMGSFIMGGQSTFKRIWSVGLLASIIGGVGMLAKSIGIVLTNNGYFSLGPAAFFPNMDATSIFFIVLMMLELVTLWSLYLAGIGYGIIFGISRGKGIAISYISFAIFAGLGILLQVVGMSFAGVELTLF